MIVCFRCVTIIKETTINDMQSYASMTSGIIVGVYSDISFHNCNFMHNIGRKHMFWISYYSSTSIIIINTSLSQNAVMKGNILFIENGIITEFQGLSVRENRGNFKLSSSKTNFSGDILFINNNGSIESEQSILHFYGITHFLNNYSLKEGGAIIAKYSELHIHHIIIIANNIAQISGGGIYLYRSELHCYFNCTFFQNIATEMGGGIHAVSSRIIASTAILKNSTKFLFSNNKARLGGAVSLK